MINTHTWFHKLTIIATKCLLNSYFWLAKMFAWDLLFRRLYFLYEYNQQDNRVIFIVLIAIWYLIIAVLGIQQPVWP